MSFIGYPRDIEHGDGRGMCVMRVLEPITPLEKKLAGKERMLADVLQGPANPLWRVCLWIDGQIFMASFVSPAPLAWDDAISFLRNAPTLWSEIVRTSPPPAAPPAQP